MTIKSTIGALLICTALPILAQAEPLSEDATIPIEITLEGLRGGTMPLYISVQKDHQYMGMKGFGTILPSTAAGDNVITIYVDKSDDYAISVWHDLNDDGVFSMTEDYRVLDGWGASGNIPTDRRPVFDDVKVSIPENGTKVRVPIIYPN